MALTPDMLRDAATYLAIDHYGPDNEFMCLCLREANELALEEVRWAAAQEFYDLLVEHGIDTRGSLCDEDGFPLMTRLNDDEFAVQCVRFNLLHLLAHELET